jgi:Flp pilus assembly protein TadD
MSDEFASTHVQRGLHLKRVRRYREAEAAFKDALSGDPENDFVLYHLTLAVWQQDGREREALDIIQQAIRIAPGDSNHHALKALIVANVHNPDFALGAANEAIRLDPTSSFAWYARAQIHLNLRKLPAAEADARKSLELDPDYDPAAGVLSHSLRLQGRVAENAEQIAGMLSRDPEDDDNHTAAGWNALQARRYAEAETHFREALRLNPENEFAREGLIEAFRSRSRIYRIYLRWTLWMQGRTAKMQLLIILGLYVMVRFARTIFTGPAAPVAGLIVVLYFIFVLWMHLARGFGNFVLLCDRAARIALRRAEKWDACVTGGCVTGAVIIGALGAVCSSTLLMLIAGTLLFASLPFAHTFVNKAPAGRILFGAAGLFVLGVGTALILDAEIGLGFTKATISGLISGAILTSVLSTWLSNVPALHR